MRPATLLKKGLGYRCFPVNFPKFLRAPFLKQHLRWFLLKLMGFNIPFENINLLSEDLDQRLVKSLDGTYARILRAAKNG